MTKHSAVNALQLVGHAMYMAERYEKALSHFTEVLSSIPCTVSAMYIILCRVKLKQTNLQLRSQTMSTVLRALQLDNIEVMMKILSTMPLEDIIELADFLVNKRFSALALAAGRVLQLQLVKFEEQEEAKVTLKKIAVDFEQTQFLSMPTETVAKYVRQCYILAVQDCSDIGIHACFVLLPGDCSIIC